MSYGAKRPKALRGRDISSKLAPGLSLRLLSSTSTSLSFFLIRGGVCRVHRG